MIRVVLLTLAAAIAVVAPLPGLPRPPEPRARLWRGSYPVS